MMIESVKRQSIKIIVATLIMVSVASCQTTQVHYLEMDVYSVAKRSFPQNIVNMTVVDNTKDLLVNDSLKGNSEIPIENVATGQFAEILKDTINRYKYFNEITAYPHRVRAGDGINGAKLLTAEQASEICAEMDADALISIDMYDLKGQIYSINSHTPSYAIEIDASCGICMFASDGKIIPPPILVRDTFYMGAYVPGQDIVPTYDQISQNVASLMAKKIAEQWIPRLETQERWFYSFASQNINKGAKAADEGDWANAETAWVAAFESEPSEAKRARAAFNVALANECLDDLERANKWIGIAMEEASKQKDMYLKIDVQKYKQILEARLKLDPKLKEQLGL